MRKYLLTALSATMLATPAFAQDTAFSGFRVEAIAGYDRLQSGEADDDGVDSSDDEGDEFIDGLAYGIGAGFDFDLGGLVAGIEGEYSDSTGERDLDESVDGLTGSFETGRDLYIGGRLGFKAGPSTLIYAKAGYTNLSLELQGSDGEFDFSGSTEIDGLRLGAGAEFLFGTNTYGKIEYRYSNYTDLQFDIEDGEDLELGDINVDRHQVVAGIGMRF